MNFQNYTVQSKNVAAADVAVVVAAVAFVAFSIERRTVFLPLTGGNLINSGKIAEKA